MNKKALKEFAVYARNELRSQIKLRAKAFGITSEGLPELHIGDDYVEVNHKTYPKQQQKAFQTLFQHYNQKGFDQLIEEVAYTWFNRLIAIRFMEVHNYLPSRIRVLSSETPGKVDPDILTDYHRSGLPIKVEEITKLIQEGKSEEAYRRLLIAQCNELSEIMPFLFEKINGYTELLLPENLLHSDSIINTMNKQLDERDFEHVEVIGWLYQYYMSEKKDEVFAGLRKNKKITKENIPAATQLFTPHWIVRYMVENSVGHMWLESHPESKIKEKMKYYIEPAEQEPEVQRKLDELINPNLSPEEITILDPACGSGHILVYAFDLLYEIYEEQGFPAKEIPKLILEKNLYGIDIDHRAAQLASFALLMKAREKSRRIFRNPPQLNIMAIEESNGLDIDAIAEQMADSTEERNQLKELLEQFINAKNYGSIIKPKELNYDRLLDKIEQLLDNGLNSIFDIHLRDQLPLVKKILKQAKLLNAQYDAVITNPPYMGSRNMNSSLSSFVQKHFPASKNDLFAVFIERMNLFVHQNGFIGSINQHSWMFLSSYEKLRNQTLKTSTIMSMLHLGPRAFEEIGGEVVQSTSYVLRKTHIPNYLSTYYRLINYTEAHEKEIAFLNKQNVIITNQKVFQDIPGSPIAYWASEQVRKIFKESNKVSEIAHPRQGLATTNNALFLRKWFEVSIKKIAFNCRDRAHALSTKKKWFPYNKGGSYRKWYGNNEYVINWENDGKTLCDYIDTRPNERVGSKGRVINREYYFKEGITWSFVSSSKFGVRYSPIGFLFDVGGSSLFPSKEKINLLLGFLCSKLSLYFMSFINPTLNFQVGNVSFLPIKTDYDESKIKSIVSKCIKISKTDWDSFETSWDFKQHPFLTYKDDAVNLEQSFANWAEHAEKQFNQLKANEEELNRIFIELYGLQDELTPEVPDEEVTVRKADRERDAKSFLSYCVGLMMGRYSLDVEGLAYAGGEFDWSKYQTFQPDKNGIIPLTDEAYFEDDIITGLKRILVAIYGEDQLENNLQWLAESLQMKSNENATQRLRRYFFDEFYHDHCRIYQKRPIYWMADSGKKKGMRALIYLHRYTPDTIATLRFQYVQELQVKLNQEEKYVQQMLANPDLSNREKKEYEKKLTTLRARQEELIEYDQKLAELANKRIDLDLDDGVVENYKKLQPILAEIR